MDWGEKYFFSQVLWPFRKNLSELDDIRKYFSHKLSAPVFSVLEERSQNSVDKKVSNDSEKDTQQLLLKSNQLVGEVNGKNKSKPVISAAVCSNRFAKTMH